VWWQLLWHWVEVFLIFREQLNLVTPQVLLLLLLLLLLTNKDNLMTSPFSKCKLGP